MTSKKQKERKKKIQERQTMARTGSAEKSRVNSLLQQLSKLHGERREVEQSLRELQREHAALQKKSASLERSFKGAQKMTVDMHNNHIEMRKALTEVRELHRFRINDYDTKVCQECYVDWPCPTYKAIRMPEQAAITSLLLIEQQLRGDT